MRRTVVTRAVIKQAVIKQALRLWPAVAVTAALVLALLAYGVLAAARDRGSGTAPGPLARIGGALVGVTDQSELRRGRALVDEASRPGLSPGAAFKRRGRAAALLAQAAVHGPAADRARASQLLAVLALADAAADPGASGQYLAVARSGFVAAIRLDPRDDASKYDLELLLTLGRKRQQARDAAAARPRSGTNRPAGKPKSAPGSGNAGSGY
ncbi:MAG: hypothetical protein JWO17_469 [Actinomycetia bacterium]|nr:hypothetical protein [Actinomycetes bacterium]